MATPTGPNESRLRAWFKKHFSNRFYDCFEGLFSLGESPGSICPRFGVPFMGVRHLLERIVTLVKPNRPRSSKPKIPNFYPRLEPLEVRCMLSSSTWSGASGVDYNWSTAANWTAGVPGTGSVDTAVFDSTGAAHSAILNNDYTIKTLLFSAGDLTTNAGSSHTLYLSGSSSSWTGGTIDGTGTLNVQSGASLAITGSGPTTLNASSLNDYGTVELISGTLNMASGTTVTVESGATWTMDATTTLSVPNPPLGPGTNGNLVNNGTVVVGGSGSAGTNTLTNVNYTQNSGG